ncbi:hypothetical protein [Lysobacter sp. CCNWLW3]|uniref:hypothetical protein n=1 Tax=Lysobacter sp. CCNWLW3 TaxID=3117014 RepID=UPI002FD301E6
MLSARSLERRVPGTSKYFQLPFYELMANEPTSVRHVRRIIDRYRSRSTGGHVWKFPDGAETFTMLRDDTGPLVARGDIWGFFGIVALVKLAEANSDAIAHAERCKDLYRAMPAVLKAPWTAPARELLRQCVEGMQARMPLSLLLFDVDWEIIDALAANPMYQPAREKRSRDPETLRFVEHDDPILDSVWISGLSAREIARQMQAAA